VPNGRFIALEGGDATGKSTQSRLLAARLGAVVTREPGGTALGEQLRVFVLDPATGDVDPRAEALILAAARAQHVAEVIRPALERGETVVSDRYIASSIAYQGFGRGLPPDEVRAMNEWATGGLWPDVIVLLELTPEDASTRLGAERDRLEAAGDGFHQRVAAGYRELAAADPDRWVVVDATGPVEEVAERILTAVTSRLP
jgi:dTMP kinase